MTSEKASPAANRYVREQRGGANRAAGLTASLRDADVLAHVESLLAAPMPDVTYWALLTTVRRQRLRPLPAYLAARPKRPKRPTRSLREISVWRGRQNRWRSRTQQRAFRRLAQEHADDYSRLVAEERAREPFDTYNA